MIDLRRKTYTRKAIKKSAWSLRETDQFGIIYGVNEKVYFSVHFEKFILCKLRFLPQFSAVIFYPQMSGMGKIRSKPRFRRGFRYE